MRIFEGCSGVNITNSADKGKDVTKFQQHLLLDFKLQTQFEISMSINGLVGSLIGYFM